MQIDTSEDIFAIGDVHGDDRLVNLLAAAKIISPQIIRGLPAKQSW